MPISDLTAFGFGWIVLSMLSTISIIWGFYLPYWIVGSISLNGKKTAVYFGSFRRCNYPVFDIATKHFRMENRCGRYAEFGDIPSVYWQISTVSIGLGCFLSLILTFILIPSCCLKHILSKNSAILVGLLQVISAIGVSCGCVIYPMGWDNPEVRDACGPAVGPFILGDCTLGWAYITMLAGSAATLVCGAISICAIKERRTNYPKFRQLEFQPKQNEEMCRHHYARQFRNSTLEGSKMIDRKGRVEVLKS